MGHYDDCYIAEQEQYDKKETKELKTAINTRVAKMSLAQLRFVAELTGYNLNDYRTFFRILDSRERPQK